MKVRGEREEVGGGKKGRPQKGAIGPALLAPALLEIKCILGLTGSSGSDD